MLVENGGVVKSEFARAVLSHRVQSDALHANEINCLKNLMPAYKAIVFDDFSYDKLGPEAVQSLINSQDVQDFSVKNSTVFRPADLVTILNVNPDSIEWSKTLEPVSTAKGPARSCR